MLGYRRAVLLAPRRKRLAKLVMHEHAAVDAQRGRVAIAHPRIVADRDREIGVLVAIVKLFVPSTDRLERLALNEQAKAR